jgi:hypothetical protein
MFLKARQSNPLPNPTSGRILPGRFWEVRFPQVIETSEGGN